MTEIDTETHTAAPPRPRSRVPLALVVALCLAWLGLVAGLTAGALWLVPKDAGLAGGPMVLGYGLLGLIAGLVVAALLAWKAPHSVLRATALAAALLAVASLAFVGWRLLDLRTERRAAAGLDEPLPPPTGFRLEARIDESDGMRRFRTLTVDGDEWRAEWVAVGPEAAECEAQMIADEAEALLATLARVEALGDGFAASCVLPEGEAVYHLAHYAEGGAEPDWTIAGNRECLRDQPEVGELHRLLGAVVLDSLDGLRLDCDT
ncbi:MAG TPA: hypothetical protein VKU40_11465 [Thermoanaerobaculia bacterium]|nr:hypothetical protein [Thermoanaerobaculia bacterium]